MTFERLINMKRQGKLGAQLLHQMDNHEENAGLLTPHYVLGVGGGGGRVSID